MNIPNWYTLLLLALASFRVWFLFAKDDILNSPRRYVTRLGSKWKEGDPAPKGYRATLGEFIDCPWCLGFWTSMAWWGLWQAWPHGTLIAAVPFAISALVPAASKLAG